MVVVVVPLDVVVVVVVVVVLMAIESARLSRRSSWLYSGVTRAVGVTAADAAARIQIEIHACVELLPWRVLWRGTASASHATVVPAPSRICTFFLACFESSIGGRARVGEPRTGRGSGCWDSCPRHRCVCTATLYCWHQAVAVISEENSRIAV